MAAGRHLGKFRMTISLERERGGEGEGEREFICHISETTYNKIHTQIQTMAGCQKGKIPS